MSLNLCNLFNSDLRYACLCDVVLIFKKERREKEGEAEFKIERVTEIISYAAQLMQHIEIAIRFQ